MVGPTESISIDRLVRQAGGSLPWVTTLIAVTAVPTPALVSALTEFRRIGRPVALVIIGGEEPDPGFSPDGVQFYHVPAEIAWEKLETVAVNTTG